MAEDISLLAEELELERPYVVGSDFGGWVAYALARLFPAATRGVMIIDVPVAGVEPWQSVRNDPALWHFGFHQAPGLAEKLLPGREAVYIDYFLRSSVADPLSVSEEDVRRYACAYARPGRLEAAMGMYRAFEENETFGRAQRGPLDVPVSLVVGEASFGPIVADIATGLERSGATDVTTDVIPNAGHYPADEQPHETATLITRYASQE